MSDQAVKRSVDDAPPELQVAIREFWPSTEWDNAASVSWLESGWNFDAENDSTQAGLVPCGTYIGDLFGQKITAEHSIGYFQINACNFATWDARRLFNARENAGTAHMLWGQRGWSPWYFSARRLGLA